MSLSQAHRFASVTTALGENALVLRRFSGTETLSSPFNFELELLSENPSVSFDNIVGTPLSIKFALANGEPRHLSGVVSRFAFTGFLGGHARYRATVVPWLWLLTRASDCRIFQEKTVPEIIESIFKQRGFADYELRLSATYRVRGYCVQYRETDFNFVSRLLEMEGIYYYFLHEAGRHVLVLCDSPGAHQPFPGGETLIYRADSGVMAQDHLQDWIVEMEIQPGRATLNDFNYHIPRHSNSRMVAQSDISSGHAHSGYEIYDYPTESRYDEQVSSYARLHIEEMHTQHRVARGHGPIRPLAPGHTFTLEEHPRPDQNAKYLVTSATYAFGNDDFSSGAGAATEPFSVTFSALPSEVPFRPRRAAHRPVVTGPQTAIVSGPAGEEIYTDEDGRVKVQFHWDRAGKSDENSSCWMRVSQGAWAGRNWGMISIPRIGQEVIVDFLEGNPDRPIITGRVYNGEQQPPYELPAHKTRTTLKSRSTKGGGTDDYNEIRFEDLKGQEQLYIHAEKDEDHVVEQHLTVSVGLGQTLSTGTNIVGKTGGDEDHTIMGNQTIGIGGDQDLTVNGGQTIHSDGNQEISCGAQIKIFAGGKFSLGAASIHESAKGDIALGAGEGISLVSGKDLLIKSTTGITLQCGGSFIHVHPGGVDIVGPIVRHNAGGAAGGGPACSPAGPKAPKAPKGIPGVKPKTGFGKA